MTAVMLPGAGLWRPPTTQVDLRDYDIILINTSGGKDSQTMLREVATQAAAQAVTDRMTVLYCNLGRVVWPGTAELARRQAEHYGLRFIERTRTQGDLLDHVRERGMWPSAAARYCTSEHKRGVAYKVIIELVAERGAVGHRPRVLNCMGLRAAESTARARRPALKFEKKPSSGRREVWTWLPIHDWTTQQVWASIDASGVPYHWAYDLGMSRLSCALCVLSSNADLLLAIQHNPALAHEYAKVEAEIGHDFRADVSMRQMIRKAERAPRRPAGRLCAAAAGCSA